MTNRTGLALLCPALLLVAPACGAAPAPRELSDARDAYERARSGPAREIAPVELDKARMALEDAEHAFDEEPEAPATRDLAYVALRRVQIAQAHTAIQLADRRRSLAERERELLEGASHRRTRAELSSAREQLAEERRQLALRQQQLESTGQALQQERAARTEAERARDAAIASLREVATVREEQRGLVITLSGAVLFASGQSTLLPIAQNKLDQVAETLRDTQGQTIVVEGHTDSRGSARQNEELSLLRAQAVRTYLITKGVPENRITAVGIGPRRPVAENNSPEGRANNRRVEIIVPPAQGAH